MNTITLTDSQVQKLLAEAKQEFVEKLLAEFGDDLQLLSPACVCGILDINQKTLDTLPDGPPRVTLVVGKVIRYRACDVAAYIRKRMG